MTSTKPPATGAALDCLATHCIAARAIIAEAGTPVMLELIDLLLFELGITLATQPDEHDPAPAPVG